MEENSKDLQYKKMTETPVLKLLVRLSIPTILSMMITSIYNMVDTAFVGRLGTSASGAVGIVFTAMAIIQSIAFMFGQGSGSILSRRLGAKDYEGASSIASTGFFFTLFVGICMMTAGLIAIEPLVYLLGSTATIAPYAKDYVFYILIAAPGMMCSLAMNNMLRYEGKAALGTVGMLTGSILNIVLDPLFMFVFKMGIRGAGLSTALSQYISFSILLYMFLSRKTQVHLSFRYVDKSPAVVFDICATGLPSLLRQSLASLSTMLLNRLAGVYGDAAIAAMSIVSRLGMSIFSFAIGIGQGFQPISAFNYGAKKYDRVKRAYLYATILGELVLAAVSIAVLCNLSDMIRIFRDDAEVIEIGTRALKLHCIALFFLPVGAMTEMLLQSTGCRATASLLSSFRSGLIFVPALLILSKIRGLYGIQEAQPLAYVIMLVPSLFIVKWYWKRLK